MTGAQSLLLRLVRETSERHLMKKAVFSKSDDTNIKRAELRPIKLSHGDALQFEIFTADNKAYHKNINMPFDDDQILSYVMSYKQINLITTIGDCEYRCSRSGNDTVIGAEKLLRDIESTGRERETVTPEGNDREKSHILRGDEPFLQLLGVSDKNGRIYDKKQSKFRQINKFIEHISYVEKYLPDDKIRICDLCCGKSYLSFAVYHYFANVRGMKVDMTGVDLKTDVIEYCSQTAKKLGFDGLEFVRGDITKYTSKIRPELVISLHACDTATDIVLQKAVEWGADVILSTPCCHHELNHTLNCPEFSFIADYSMLRQKFCDAATDALRLKLLEANGYATAALELIDPEETPKNIMLRAIRKKSFDPESDEAKLAADEYEKAKSFLVRK